MLRKLVLIGLVCLLALGCLVVLFSWISRPAQAALVQQSGASRNVSVFGKYSLSADNENTLGVTSVNSILIPSIMKGCFPSFSDDFSNPASGWGSYSDANVTLGYLNGEYRIATNPNWIAWVTQDFGTSNFQVELDTRYASQNLDGIGGIMFSLNSSGFYMYSVIDGFYSLWRIDSSWNTYALVPWTYAPSVIRPGYEINHMKVVRNGSTIAIYANNTLLTSKTDSTYQGTEVGMISGAFDYYFDQRFDNFIMYTGTCVGVLGTSSLENQSAQVGFFQLEPGAGFTKP